MEENKILFLAIIGCIIIYALVRAYKISDIRCPKCGERMELHSLEDPMGANISKKVTFSFYQGPRKYKEAWVCESCNHQVQKQYWGS
ncbi:hypothetical protein R50072_11030 [Simiduia litorea]|uniref:hypothetical protein n=1 Tax=Simiduia litorea TaxID=1435348 RepID=UPI0036F37D77